MKKKTPSERQKQKIYDFLKIIDCVFGVNNYSKKINFAEKDLDCEEKGVTADIITNHKYRRITLTLYPLFWTQNKKEQRKCLIHELCHTITQASKDASYKLINGHLITVMEMNSINENSTSQIENILDDFLKGDMDWAIKAYKNYLK